MQKLKTVPPYEAYKSLAQSKAGFPGDKEFINLLIPTLKEVSDEVIEVMLPIFFPNWIGKKFNAIEVAIIREYVIRVENTEAEEWEARRRLAEYRQSLQNDPLYTGIQPKQPYDPTFVATEDRYARYTVHQFQDEIDFLCKRSLEAQLNGDRDVAFMLQRQAEELTQRQIKLRMQTESMRKGKAWNKWAI